MNRQFSGHARVMRASARCTIMYSVSQARIQFMLDQIRGTQDEGEWTKIEKKLMSLYLQGRRDANRLRQKKGKQND